MSVLTASVWNRSGCLVGQFERSEFGRACEMVEESDEVCLDFEEWGESGLIDERQETLTGAEFVRLYGGGRAEIGGRLFGRKKVGKNRE